MRTLGIVAGLVALALLPLATTGAAETGRVAEGHALYLDNCSLCHGVITAGSLQHPRGQASTAHTLRTTTIPAAGFPEPIIMPVTVQAGRHEVFPAKDGTRVAIAPPYGPPLRGVYGRPAGSVQGFTYSAEFLKVLRGIIWNRDTLNRWITDSQKWVSGSVMYYKQADPEIRQKIIDYLEIAK